MTHQMPTSSDKKPEPFNPNLPDPEGTSVGFPVFENAYTVDDYARVFAMMGAGEPASPFQQWVDKQVTEITTSKSKTVAKASPTALPPDMMPYSKISMMPDVTTEGGVVQWQGIPPEALRKMVRENLIPQVIIGMRVDDVQRYAAYSTHPWKPGWVIKTREGYQTPNQQDEKDIREARTFLENCTIETTNARKRDAKKLTGFSRFLAALVRDSLTYDGMAVWTDMDLKDRVKSFKVYSAFNIRLTGPNGYKEDKEIFAVAVDEGGNVIHKFTRFQLIWYVRNNRADADIFGYGYPELEMAIRLVQGFQNALDMNADTFNRNSIPNGFLVVKGKGWNQRQLDILSRIWMNLKRGVTKSWSLPVIPVPPDGDIDIKNMKDLKGTEAFYQDFMNMLAGLFCAIYRFPTTRLGYRISGRGPDSKVDNATSSAAIIDEDDNGLEPLLRHIASMINEYIVWTRWPHLEFRFSGSNPREDAREYEQRINAATQDERRALSDMPKMETLGNSEEEKKIARILGLCPVDPNLAGVFQATIAALIGGQNQGKGGPEGEMRSKTDPAISREHGHESGIRRDSAQETKSAENK